MSDLPTLFAHEHAPSTAITQPAATTAAAVPDPPSRPLPAPADWPQPPDNVALTGLAGDIVAAIAPNTEADPVAILAQLLVAFGAAVGRGAWFEVEATRHHPNEFVCAARRLVVSPVQPGVIRKDITGSNGLPRSER